MAIRQAKARGAALEAHERMLADQRKVEALDRLAPVAGRLRALKAERLTVRAICR
jgi:hypothetical protein